MTPTEIEATTPLRARRTARRIIAGAAVAGITSLTMLVTVSSDAAASRRTTSDVLAAEAGTALEALDRWHETQDPVDYVRFVTARDDLAAVTEAEMELLPGALQQAWSGLAITNLEALLSAVSQLGVPYRSIASEPGVGFDCSGLTMWAFAQADVEIPRVSGDQIRAADGVDRDAAEAGDLVYYPGHISMYLGADVMVHSPNSGNHVEIVHLPTSKSLRFGDATPTDVEAVETDVGPDSGSNVVADAPH